MNDLYMRMGAYTERLLKVLNDGWYTLPSVVVSECELKDKVLALCHIITEDTNTTKEVALLERDIGLQTTYLLSNIMLPENPEEIIAYLFSLGHEVGIVPELIVPLMDENAHPHETMRKLLKPFDKMQVIPTTMMIPSSPFSKHVNVDNEMFFTEFGEEKTINIEVTTERYLYRSFRAGVHSITEYGMHNIINKVEYANTYDNQFELIQPEHTGRSLLKLNVSQWEVGVL